MRYDLTHALISLRPNSEWVMRGNNYEDLEWKSYEEDKPTEEELLQEVDRLQELWNMSQYKRDRAAAYPDFKEYLDGIVKGDQNQIQEYINSCLEVKEKYPKPS